MDVTRGNYIIVHKLHAFFLQVCRSFLGFGVGIELLDVILLQRGTTSPTVCLHSTFYMCTACCLLLNDGLPVCASRCLLLLLYWHAGSTHPWDSVCLLSMLLDNAYVHVEESAQCTFPWPCLLHLHQLTVQAYSGPSGLPASLVPVCFVSASFGAVLQRT